MYKRIRKMYVRNLRMEMLKQIEETEQELKEFQEMLERVFDNEGE